MWVCVELIVDQIKADMFLNYTEVNVPAPYMSSEESLAVGPVLMHPGESLYNSHNS